jgi:hypothetical protein
MNIERLKIEAERLRSWDHSKRLFDMSNYIAFSRAYLPCKTVCCIAGDLYLEHSSINPFPNGELEPCYPQNQDVFEFAKEYLELTEKQADWLFFGKFTHLPMDEITPELAAQAIDLLISCDGRILDENYEREMLP